ncbi:hypothetical protein IFM89_004985 [Coptis chinensis]|uniref:Hydroxyproline O-arabinosyltransferase-like domain-containing protein n=1 Tax=Coptis chinensis TaxID=261450 RepID=A0A835HTB8_9MAGN|nr:hypothetical protein IFM89_004985 [Coptis chinensis]
MKRLPWLRNFIQMKSCRLSGVSNRYFKARMWLKDITLNYPKESAERTDASNLAKVQLLIAVTLGLFFLEAQGKLTYGKIGEWRFDKRSYLRGPPPRNLPLPPPGVPESVVMLVTKVNEATANIPGWDTF